MHTHVTTVGGWLAVLAGLSGCAADAPHRAMTIEFQSKEGLWRLEGVEAATLDMPGWRVRVTDTEISDLQAIPHLGRFTLAIVNTSADRSLHLEPREIFVAGADRRALWLGPPEPMVVKPGKRVSLIYDKGVDAVPLLYPFTITVTVFGGPDAAEPRKAVLRLY